MMSLALSHFEEMMTEGDICGHPRLRHMVSAACVFIARSGQRRVRFFVVAEHPKTFNSGRIMDVLL
jgi:hypothetical protein